jgi:hypothetical protein
MISNYKVIGKMVYVSILASGCTTIKSRPVLDALVEESLHKLDISYSNQELPYITEAVLEFMEVVTPSGTAVVSDSNASDEIYNDAIEDFDDMYDEIEGLLNEIADLTDCSGYEAIVADYILQLKDLDNEFDVDNLGSEASEKLNDIKVLISDLNDQAILMFDLIDSLRVKIKGE